MGIKRQFLWNMAPLLVISAVNIISVRLFWRYLGTEMYALWMYVNTLNGTFGFMDLGLGAAVARYLGIALGAQDRKALEEYWGTGNLLALVIVSVMAIVFIVVGVFLGPVWFQVSPAHISSLRWAFVAGGFSLWLSFYGNFWLVLSQAHFDFKFIGLWRSILNVAQVATSLWLAWLTRNPVVLIWAGVLFGLVQLFIFVRHALTRYRLGLNLRHSTIARAKELFGISNKVFGAVLVGTFGNSIDKLILGKLAPPATFTYYSVSSNFGSRISMLGLSTMGPVASQTSRAVGMGDRQKTVAIFNESFDWMFGFYALGAVWTVFWHRIFLRLWLDGDYAQSVTPAFTPLVIAFCITGIGMVSAAQLVPLNRAGVELVFAIIRTICMGLLAALGWYWGGLAGVAWGVLASRVVTIAQDLYAIRLIGGGGWLAWHTWRNLLVQFAVGGAFFATSRFLPAESLWLIAPAALHGALIGAWLLRNQIRKILSKP
ncbi:MAG TPA: oligosaccharide flippase family protein [Verrucomicrobiae bacterium]|nr:oligosaccharide flippase family protein [Verrucomicrobiae bacterium]